MRARVDRQYFSRDIGILLYEEILGFNGEEIRVVKPVQWILESYNPGQIIEPTFRIDDRALQDIVNGLAELKIKPESSHKLEGQLEAAKYHLEDLRTLLKLRKP